VKIKIWVKIIILAQLLFNFRFLIQTNFQKALDREKQKRGKKT
jgi:lipid-A-disaccharide synthase-like uncharacterized protein